MNIRNWCFLIALAWGMTSHLAAQDDDFQKRVDAAIDKGAQYLATHYPLGQQPGEKPQGTDQGYLSLYAMIHAGRKQDNVLIEKWIDKLIKTAPKVPTYENGILALALALRNGAGYQPVLNKLENGFWATQTKYGGWGYGDQMVIDDDNLSTAQFAVLGLHSCMRAHMINVKKVKIAPDLLRRWTTVANYWLEAQNEDGGWDYSVQDRTAERSYINMTCAGISSLAVCRIYLSQDKDLMKKIDQAIADGKKWLESWDDKEGGGTFIGGPASYGYGLYSLEKACDLAGIKELNGKDWYRRYAEIAMNWQQPDGHWIDVKETAFVILFLKRASRTILTGDKPGQWAGPLQDKARDEPAKDDKTIESGQDKKGKQ